jgi:hypothetical protein
MRKTGPVIVVLGRIRTDYLCLSQGAKRQKLARGMLLQTIHLIRRHGRNKQDVQYYRYTILCDTFSPLRQYESARLCKTSSHKYGCT